MLLFLFLFAANREFIESRRRALVRFLTLVVRHPVFHSSDVIRYFLTFQGAVSMRCFSVTVQTVFVLKHLYKEMKRRWNCFSYYYKPDHQVIIPLSILAPWEVYTAVIRQHLRHLSITGIFSPGGLVWNWVSCTRIQAQCPPGRIETLILKDSILMTAS